MYNKLLNKIYEKNAILKNFYLIDIVSQCVSRLSTVSEITTKWSFLQIKNGEIDPSEGTLIKAEVHKRMNCYSREIWLHLHYNNLYYIYYYYGFL